MNSQRFHKIIDSVTQGAQGQSQNGRYRHWDTLRNLQAPDDLTTEEWWFGIKFARTSSARPLPLTSVKNEPFTYVITDEVLQYLRFVDQHCSGEIRVDEPVLRDESRRNRILVNSVIEEATRSSQLEGATTTRRDAKEMIRTGRKPRDRSEQMVLNNYYAMEYIREHHKEDITPEAIVELQRILTDRTLDDQDDVGRVQGPGDERVAVYYDPDDMVVHQPPPAEVLPMRMQLMCDFANAGLDATPYVHPVIRAIVLHLWLAYDHPFADGNGRTARALFYWSMMKNGYWLSEYLSISKVLRDGPTRYGRAFLYTESDSCDATYFILNQLAVIKRAFEELKAYLARKMEEIQQSEQVIFGSDRFNGRQLALLRHALRHPDMQYTAKSHSLSHRVTLQSARNDLAALEAQGLLSVQHRGRLLVYRPAVDITTLLNR